MARLHDSALALPLALALAACGSDPEPQRPPSAWTDIAGMLCADGSPTGIGVLAGRSDAVLVYLAGGGACWRDRASCSNTLRAFGRTEFEFLQLLASGTVFDRTLAGNPFSSWTFVYVPYCTGDVHAGDAVQTYGGVTWNHHGWRNLGAAVGALTAALPRPANVVVAGSSAGGFGALAAYDLVRDAWDPAGGTSAALLDDSGPTFVGTSIPPSLLATWWDGWSLGSTLGVRCPQCESDLSEIWRTLVTNHRDDRLALLSTTQDATMRAFFADPDAGSSPPPMSPAAFEAALGALAAKLGPLGPTVATYRIDGADAHRHALLLDRSFLPFAAGTPVLDWISDMSSGAPWSSVP